MVFKIYDLFLAEAFVLGKIITDLWSRPRLESNTSNITSLFIHLTFYVFAKLYILKIIAASILKIVKHL